MNVLHDLCDSCGAHATYGVDRRFHCGTMAHEYSHATRSMVICVCLQPELIGRSETPSRLQVDEEEANRLCGTPDREGDHGGSVPSFLRKVRSFNQRQIESLTGSLLTSSYARASKGSSLIEVIHTQWKGCPCKINLATGACHHDAVFSERALYAETQHPFEHVCITGGMSDFEAGEGFSALVEDIVQRYALSDDSCSSPMRVAVIGTRTEGKVFFMLYDLVTRLSKEVTTATCRALTASSSAGAQQAALLHIKNTLGMVEVFDHAEGLYEWLVGDEDGGDSGGDLGVSAFGGMGGACEISIDGKECPLRAEVRGSSIPLRSLLSLLFNSHWKVDLRTIAVGNSGSVVLRCSSTSLSNLKERESIVKIDSDRMIDEELFRFNSVKDVLGTSAPAVMATVRLRSFSVAAVRFQYAAMSGRKIRSFASYFSDPSVELKSVVSVIQHLYGADCVQDTLSESEEDSGILRPLLQAREEGVSMNLLADARFIAPPAKLRQRNQRFQGLFDTLTTQLRGRAGQCLFTTSRDSAPAEGIACFREWNESGGVNELVVMHAEKEVLRVTEFAEFYRCGITKCNAALDSVVFDNALICGSVSFVHGDLHGENIVIDKGNNVFLIDFAKTAKAHALTDLARLECNVLTVFHVLDTESSAFVPQFLDAITIIKLLTEQSECGSLSFEPDTEHPHCPAGLRTDAMRRVWSCIATLRAVIRCNLPFESKRSDALLLLMCAVLAQLIGWDELGAANRLICLLAASAYAQRVWKATCGSVSAS